MKSLELSLNKRLLIVEIEMLEYVASMLIGDFFPKYELEFICKGSDLTEDIAKGMVEYNDLNDPFLGTTKFYKKYPLELHEDFVNTALDSFISAIESKGYHWGENPEGKSRPNFNDYSSLISYQGDCRDWDLAESRTFHPEKTLIFEIL